ncbi:Smr domain-containing protein [Desulfobotulus alkaliphilus]|uniref:Smr domain-containing protein n=1 Tax=Desulfobotulus alkaliphilus TaxID=622671 RepID=A0A562RNP2_9BACT|nr:Smr/MutS family protein [Desulfobotulus alkaliphilus]TWI70652.1 Smr domain-containing protein [Desulfobotulus alkaliphilus]
MKDWLLGLWRKIWHREEKKQDDPVSLAEKKRKVRAKKTKDTRTRKKKSPVLPPAKASEEVSEKNTIKKKAPLPEALPEKQAPGPDTPPEDSGASLPKAPKRRMRFRKKAAPPSPEIKEKIPVLDTDADLFVLMGGDPEKEGPVQEPDLPEPEIIGEVVEKPKPVVWTSPGKTLDLHGLNSAQADVRMRSAILTARVEGVSVMRIITGKGLHSEGGNGVLRDYAEEFLTHMQKTGEIRMFRWEAKTKRKSGAVLVKLPEI